jgi:tRNA (guanine37-N1)-methyltransferase
VIGGEHFWMDVDLETLEIRKEFLSIVVPPRLTLTVLDKLKIHGLLPTVPNLSIVMAEPGVRRILLSDGTTSLPPDVTELVGDVPLTPYSTVLNYRNFTLQEILRMHLPEGCVIPSAFETIGHIAHLNLLDEQLPYKHLIGRAIILKNPVIKTVVMKVGTVHSVFRTMDLELLAGEPNFETNVRPGGLHLQLDFSKVYWNSRLESEHQSLVASFTESAVVADAMCGIGPFAIRAARHKRCRVFANDLNPESFKWLQRNVALNLVVDLVECSNLDAREFIRRVFAAGGCDYVVMNLPATAVEFLDVIAECAVKYRGTARLPIVHFYSFDSKDQNHELSLLQRARAALGIELPSLAIHKVRDVSPGKDMFRCTFSVADLFMDDQSPARAMPQDTVKP